MPQRKPESDPENDMETIKKFITKYYEQLAYLFFGGLATLLNQIGRASCRERV